MEIYIFYSWHLKVIYKNTVQFISLQEACGLILLLNAVPYDITLASKAKNELWGIQGNGPQNNLTSAAVSPSVHVSKDIRTLCSSDDKDSL